MPQNVHGLLLSLTQANLTLFVFNFIPAFPMDGGRLLRAVLALVLPYRQATTIAAMVGQGLAILFVVVGLKFSFWLVLIGAFIFLGAEGEERVVRMRSVLRDLNVRRCDEPGRGNAFALGPVSRGIALIYQTGQDDFPVLEQGRLVGIVARSQLIAAMNAQEANTPVMAIMDANVTLASPWEKLASACEELINGTSSNAVVVVNDGHLVGMVSPENINRYLLLQSSLKSPRRRVTCPPATRDFANSNASARDFRRSSNCSSSTSRRICPTIGPGVSPRASKSWPFNSGSGFDHFRRQLRGLGLEEFVILQVPVARRAIDPVEFEFVGKRVAGEHALEFGRPHLFDKLKSHVLADAAHDLLDLLVRKPEPAQDRFRHLRADPVVVVEPVPVRRALKVGGLPTSCNNTANASTGLWREARFHRVLVGREPGAPATRHLSSISRVCWNTSPSG